MCAPVHRTQRDAEPSPGLQRMGDPPARVAYDPLEQRYVVTFKDLDLVRVYERD